jgi:hypothetical protein
MGYSDIKAFLLCLAVEEGIAASTQDQALTTSASCKNFSVTELVLSQSKEREDDDDLHPPPTAGKGGCCLASPARDTSDLCADSEVQSLGKSIHRWAATYLANNEKYSYSPFDTCKRHQAYNAS